MSHVRMHAGSLTVGVVTFPFSFEGRRRRKQAMEGIAALRECVDCLLVVANDKLLETSDASTSLNDAFKQADDVLRLGVQVRVRGGWRPGAQRHVGAPPHAAAAPPPALQGITDIITTPGEVNIDMNGEAAPHEAATRCAVCARTPMAVHGHGTHPTVGVPAADGDDDACTHVLHAGADIRTVITNSGTAMLGMGVATGPDRAEQAALMAVRAPLLLDSVEHATGVLVCFVCVGRGGGGGGHTASGLVCSHAALNVDAAMPP
jgi:hypothetical protein